MFNIRVYGILIDENQVLVTDEFRMGQEMTKFPGGGLEFGEGTIDCIKREAIEEFGQEIDVLDHLYTTDIYQPSAFNEKHQLISIYYLIKPMQPFAVSVVNEKYNFAERIEGAQTFRWIALSDLTPDDMTFPIDKKVVEIIKNLQNRKSN